MDGKQLKNSILQWAIQGKLVPQNPKDEPAPKLLERIAASRNGDVSPWSGAIGSSKNSKKSLSTSLRGAKATKQSKNQPSRIYCENGVWYEQVGTAIPKDISDEIPFEIPENWVWCRLAQLAEIQSSKRVFEKDYVTTGIPFFRSKEIGELSRGESIHTELYITKQHYKELKEKYGVPQVGDILLTSVGSIGNLWICDGREFYYKDGNVTQICSNSSFDSQYVALYLSSPLFFEQIRSSVAGTAYNALTIIKLKSLILPLPPLAEQKRIVAKLEQVLPLAEEYGAAQEQLDKLNKELPEALKKSILQEAIQGKLVPQNPKDESAQKLLERIERERNAKIKSGEIKLTKPEKNIKKSSPEYDIPQGWCWCQLVNICRAFGRIGFRGYTKEDLVTDSTKGALSLSPSNMKDHGMEYNVCTYISWEKYEESPEIKIENGDLLIVKTGSSYGKAVIVENLPCKATINPQIAVIKDICIEKKYLLYFLQSPFAREKYEDFVLGTSIPTFSQANLLSIGIPLPPLAEQKRIVKKIEELHKVIDSWH